MSRASTEDDATQNVLTKSIKIGQFTASAVVEDEEVPLYGIEHTDERTATCWIESEEGKSFGVQWMDSVRSVATAGGLRVDGMECGTKVKSAEPQGNNGSGSSAKIDYCNLSNTLRKKLVFSKIETTDDDAYSNQSIPEEFGLIKLSIWRVDVLGPGDFQSNGQHQILDKVHERSKKAMVHQARLGDSVPQSKAWLDLKYRELLATFQFRYRPRGYLQANGMIPIFKKRKAVTEDIIDLTVDDDDASEAGASDRDEQIRALEAQIQALKQKGKKPQHKRVKKEVKAEILEIQ